MPKDREDPNYYLLRYYFYYHHHHYHHHPYLPLPSDSLLSPLNCCAARRATLPSQHLPFSFSVAR